MEVSKEVHAAWIAGIDEGVSRNSALAVVVVVLPEPAEFQCRVKPDWDEKHPWTDWDKCKPEAASDYLKNPTLHNWTYEVRKLFTEQQVRALLATGGQAQADKEMQLAMQEASSLSQSIFKRHYSDDEHYASGRVVWGLCDSLRGVISQIDNMTSGLVRAPQQGDARVALLTAIEDSGQGLRYELNCLVNNGINTFNVYDSQKEEFISYDWSTDPVAAIDSAAIAAAKEGSAW